METTTFELAGEPEMTERQKKLLLHLIFENIGSPEIREEYLSQMNGGLSRFDASELISSLIPLE